MNDQVLTVDVEDPIRLAIQMMLWGGYRHLPVLRDGELAGVISDRDLHEAGAQDLDPSTPVGRVMSTNLLTAKPDEPLPQLAAAMAAARVDCMPVVSDGKMIGIITSYDLLTQMARGMMPEVPVRAPASVSDVMCTRPESVHPDDALHDALLAMVDKRIRHLPVVDDHGRLVGMVSDRDLRTIVGDPVQVLQDENEDERLHSVSVGEIMTENPIAVTPETPLDDLGWSLLDERVGAVPVVDDDERLVGIVSYIDVLHFVLRGLGTGRRAQP